VCLAWAAVSVAAWKGVVRRHGGARAVRLAYWSLNALVFFNAWYSLHQAAIPASGLAGSPLVMLTGALEGGLPLRVGVLPMPAACVLAAALLVVHALRTSASLRRGLLGGLALAVVLPLGWARLRDPGAPRPFRAPRNIVVIGVDSLQQNRLAVGGAQASAAPHVDDFLRGSVRFENAWTPLARTYPSWLSLLSGRDPVRHGGRFNLIPDEHLAPDNPYLPALLAGRGWSTFHATDETRFCILRPQMGYQELLHPRMGVADFFLASLVDVSTANLVRQSELGHELYPALKDNRASVAYNPELFTRDLIRALDRLPRDRPAFVSMHLCGNHWPFSAPAPYAHAGDDPVENCIRMVDGQVADVLAWLRAAGLLERSVVALLSDHGDGWSGDPHDRTNAHGDDFRSLWANRIVLGIRAPGLQPARHAAFVRIQDVHPTLLELAGEAPAAAAVDGRSLMALVRGEPDAPRTLYAETDLDSKLYTVKQLIDQQSIWYRVDRATGLVFLSPRAVEEFSFYKSYMLLDGDRRLEVTPYQRSVRLYEFDPRSGLDASKSPLELPDERQRMLGRSRGTLGSGRSVRGGGGGGVGPRPRGRRGGGGGGGGPAPPHQARGR
jgi:arylsulfatase A-like enzyme